MNLRDELDELMGHLREGSIQDAQVARLDQILAEHPDLLDRFVDLALLRADLVHALSGRTPSLPLPGRRRLPWAVAAAALVALAALLLVSVRIHRDEPADGPSFEGCAVLAHAVDPAWEGSSPGTGSVLPKGRLTLVSGWAQIEFFSGARVVLEGPAEFELLSKNEAACRYGKLRAFVPPQAEGFAIRTDAMRLVDRGTEFGLRLDRGGDTEVHVFQGKVELHKGTTAPENVAVGEAVRIDSAGGTRSIPADPRAFVTPSDLAQRSSLEAKGRYARWRGTSGRLRDDPRVALYYSFEDQETWAPELRSQRPDRSPLDGAIVGCRWTEGRWPEKKALEFKGPGDRVRFRDLGSYESITLAAWVRVDGLDRPFSGLMLTDGWTTGSVHWQITQKGVLRLGIHGERVSFDYDTPVLFEAGQMGRWTHVCTVYDRDARRVTHYVDGRAVRPLALRFDTALKLGSAELGNWSAPIPGFTATYAVRNLNGRMDEFVLFGKALGESEVRDLWAAGAP
jgi:hypothetical protein